MARGRKAGHRRAKKGMEKPTKGHEGGQRGSFRSLGGQRARKKELCKDLDLGTITKDRVVTSYNFLPASSDFQRIKGRQLTNIKW